MYMKGLFSNYFVGTSGPVQFGSIFESLQTSFLDFFSNSKTPTLYYYLFLQCLASYSFFPLFWTISMLLSNE